MFVYQSLIMAAVVISIYILAMLLKTRNRKLLVFSIIGLITAGGIGLYAIQYYFGNHYYEQNVDTTLFSDIKFTSHQKSDMLKTFSNYGESSAAGSAAGELSKIYNVKGNGAHSVINSNIYLFTNEKDADKYFAASQKFYDNKTYIPLDGEKSKKTGDDRYLVSFIKSQYKDYTDLIYLPSKITYSSDVVIQNGNVIIQLTETSNKPVTNKDTVILDIEKELNSSNA